MFLIGFPLLLLWVLPLMEGARPGWVNPVWPLGWGMLILPILGLSLTVPLLRSPMSQETFALAMLLLLVVWAAHGACAGRELRRAQEGGGILWLMYIAVIWGASAIFACVGLALGPWRLRAWAIVPLIAFTAGCAF